MDSLNLQAVAKRFGDHQVLKDLSLRVPAGALYGFVGANGAGKTTTMKLILGLETCDAGTITVAGTPVRYGRSVANRGIGYLPDVPEYYDYLSPTEYLTLCGQVAGMPRGELAPRVQAMLQAVELPLSRRRIHGFSRGMRQRLGIAQALLTAPQLLICDEPTSALDPTGRSELLTLLAGLRGRTTVLFSTHILSDVERVCDRIGILAGGRLQVEGDLATLRQTYAHDRLTLTFATPETAAAAGAALAALPLTTAPAPAARLAQGAPAAPATTVTVQATTVTVPFTGHPEAAMRTTMQTLLAHDLTPQTLAQAQTSLEDIFMEVTR